MEELRKQDTHIEETLTVVEYVSKKLQDDLNMSFTHSARVSDTVRWDVNMLQIDFVQYKAEMSAQVSKTHQELETMFKMFDNFV